MCGFLVRITVKTPPAIDFFAAGAAVRTLLFYREESDWIDPRKNISKRIYTSYVYSSCLPRRLKFS
jgi:hypothetical protein